MGALEQLLMLFVAAVILAAGARRVGAPYPVFLALGGALLAFVPAAPSFTLPPELALALFVAPVLLDAAYDASVRDLKDNWVPVTSLVVVAVGLTTGGGCRGASQSPHGELHRRAVQTARQAVVTMRANDEIVGDDAFHEIEEELDWMEMTVGREDGRP